MSHIIPEKEYSENIVIFVLKHTGRAMRKRVFGHMWTAKALISMHIRAV